MCMLNSLFLHTVRYIAHTDRSALLDIPSQLLFVLPRICSLVFSRGSRNFLTLRSQLPIICLVLDWHCFLKLPCINITDSFFKDICHLQTSFQFFFALYPCEQSWGRTLVGGYWLPFYVVINPWCQGDDSDGECDREPMCIWPIGILMLKFYAEDKQMRVLLAWAVCYIWWEPNTVRNRIQALWTLILFYIHET